MWCIGILYMASLSGYIVGLYGVHNSPVRDA